MESEHGGGRYRAVWAGVDAELFAKIVDSQRGLFTRAQARRCGYSAFQIRARLADHTWARVVGPVLAPFGMRITTRLRDLAAQLAVPSRCSPGRPRARWHGVDVPDGGSYLAVGAHDNPKLPGVRLLRQPIGRHDLLLVDGVLVTTRERAIFDCLRVLTGAAAIELLDRALQRRWITVDSLVARVGGWSGRRGAPQLARLVLVAGSGARSAAERRAGELLNKAGITGWTGNFQICDERGVIGEGDLVFEAERLVVELDGWAFHVTAQRFQRDRQRQNRLIRAGWTVLRFTWRDLTERPADVVATIRATLAR